MTNNNTYMRPVIPAGNSFYINIALDKFIDGAYTEFDLTKATDLKVYLICATHNTEIPLDYEIIPGIDNVLRCFVDYRLLHTTSYGIAVEGYDEHDIHFRFLMLPKEGFLVVNNTSGMKVTDDVQVIDISGRVGWGIQTDGDLTNYYTKTQVDNMIAEIEVEIGDTYTKEEINQLLTQYPTNTEINTRFNNYYTKQDTNSLLDNKQDELVSGQNIKTINNQSLLGSGNIVIEGTEQLQADWTQTDTSAKDYIKHKPTIPAAQVNSDWNATSGVAKILNKPDLSIYATEQELDNYYDKGETDGLLNNKVDVSTLNNDYYNKNTVDNLLDAKVDTSDLAPVATSGSYNDLTNKPDLSVYATHTELNTKQDTLVSGTNIKTINNQSLLGSGNVDIQSGGFVPLVNGNKTGLVNSLSKYYNTNIGRGAVIEGDGIVTVTPYTIIEASGDYSHAEGSITKALGKCSHAEGSITTAGGDYSHAEGQNTKTTNIAEHASGYNNISTASSDPNIFDPTNSTATLFSVGNGSDVYNKHNAFEIKMNGDIYLNDGTKLQDKLDDSDEVTANALYELNSRLSETELNVNLIPDEIDSKIVPVNEKIDDISNDVIDLTNDIDNTNLANSLILTELHNEIDDKQDELVSGTNIKTVNGNSLLGSGDITVGGGVQSDWNETDTSSLAYIQNKPTIQEPGFVKVGSGLVNYKSTYVDDSSIGNGAVIEGSGATQFVKIKAPGPNSHAEGQATNSYGAGSHAEGFRTAANGNYSHAGGSYTEASNYSECAIGQYNISTYYNNNRMDVTSATGTLFSIGNGTSASAKHNAFEVKMNGDIYLNDGSHPISSTTNGLKIEVVQALPATPDANTIYIIQ